MNKDKKEYKEVLQAVQKGLNLSNSLIPTALTVSEQLNMDLETVEAMYELMLMYGVIEPYNGPYLFCASPLFPYSREQKTRMEKYDRLGY